MIVTKPCPICKHTDVVVGTENLQKVDFPEQIMKIGVCDNCFNVYCYQIESKDETNTK